jgi:hypothetical protein
MRNYAMRATAAMAVIAVAMATGIMRPHNVHAETSSHTDISGFWVPRYSDANVPTASLTPAAMRRQPEVKKQEDHLRRFCNNLGMPALMYSGPGMDVGEGLSEIVIVTQINATPRHIYLNREHPDAKIFDPSTNGNSIGRWVGNKLIVDTTGFDDKGMISIPGGGYRTSTSHLVESYEVIDGGKYLEVVSTWTDPKTFVKPHTYLMLYSHAPVGYRTEDWDCVPADNVRGKAMTDTPQPVVWEK